MRSLPPPDDETDEAVVFDDPTYAAGFAMLPRVVMRDKELPVGARFLYAALLSYAWEREKGCFPGQARLTAELGMSETCLRTHLKALVKRGLIKIERQGRGKTNLYRIVALDDVYGEIKTRGIRGPEIKTLGIRGSRPAESEGKVEEVEIEASPNGEAHRVSAREAAPRHQPVKYGKRIVPQPFVDLAAAALTEYGRQTGQLISPFTQRGNPSESLKKVMGRILDWPDLAFDDHRRIIERTLRNRWWGAGPPSIGVIYGPKVWEANMNRPADEPPRAPTRDERIAEHSAVTDRRFAAMERLMKGDNE